MVSTKTLSKLHKARDEYFEIAKKYTEAKYKYAQAKLHFELEIDADYEKKNKTSK